MKKREIPVEEHKALLYLRHFSFERQRRQGTNKSQWTCSSCTEYPVRTFSNPQFTNGSARGWGGRQSRVAWLQIPCA